MKVKVTVESTHEEIEILKSASKMIDAIAEDIDNEGIDTFAGLGEYELRNIRDNIDDIVEELKKFKKEEENNG